MNSRRERLLANLRLSLLAFSLSLIRKSPQVSVLISWAYARRLLGFGCMPQPANLTVRCPQRYFHGDQRRI
ncbi:hypothetical protein TNCV_142281 [Trichonephila clavipes]|nr:hypothetical protein TNCV_142281 [Trichonephila clavipes]